MPFMPALKDGAFWRRKVKVFLKEVHMKVRKPLWVVIPCFLLVFFACVTINIYFPAEKVESVAGEIVDEIRGQGGGEEKSPAEQKGSFLRKIRLAFAPAVAMAQEAVEVSNPTIRALKEQMKGRYAQMKPYYQKGMLKEGGDGYVSLGATGVGLKEKRDLNALVAAENKDRKRLYEEVAKALNIDPGQINKIEAIFAKEWQRSVP
jgi:uncharacterized protein YdbL (DUF1318 family)